MISSSFFFFFKWAGQDGKQCLRCGFAFHFVILLLIISVISSFCETFQVILFQLHNCMEVEVGQMCLDSEMFVLTVR